MTTTLFRYRLPFRAPLPLSTGTLTHREGLLLRLETDERTAWGEIAPLPGFSHESLDEVTRSARRCVALIDGSAPEEWSVDELPALQPSVRFGFSAARAELLGTLWPEESAEVELNALLTTRDPATLREETLQLLDEGYRCFKLKVGRRPLDEDVARIEAVADTLPAEGALRLDANRAWTFEQAERIAEMIRELPVEYVEEPLENPGELRALAGQMPVALDESVRSLTAEGIAAHRFATAVILKPMLDGSIEHVRSLIAEAKRHEITAVISGTFESGIGLRHLAALATETGSVAGLGTHSRLERDLFESPLPLDGPLVRLHHLDPLPPVSLRDLERLT